MEERFILPYNNDHNGENNIWYNNTVLHGCNQLAELKKNGKHG